MTGIVHLDATALIRRHLADEHTDFVNDTMRAAEHWAVSALAVTELRLLVHRTGLPEPVRHRIAGAIAADLEAMWTVPVDGTCLARAAELGATFGIGTAEAIHLAAADRLPRPTTVVTFDRRLIPTATALGMEVRSPLVG